MSYILDKDITGMTKDKAICKIMEGKKVHNIEWMPNEYVWLPLTIGKIQDEEGVPFDINSMDPLGIYKVWEPGCIVQGCVNKKSQGEFVGNLCSPCHHMLTTGDIGNGNTFIHTIAKKLHKVINIVKEPNEFS